MKKELLLLIMAVYFANISAQKDATMLSVTYDVYYQKFEEEPKREKDLMRLDIGQHSSQYVSV